LLIAPFPTGAVPHPHTYIYIFILISRIPRFRLAMVEQYGGMHVPVAGDDSTRLSFLTGGYEKSKRKLRRVFRRRSNLHFGDFGNSGNRFTDRTRTSRDSLPTISDSTLAYTRGDTGIKASSFHAASMINNGRDGGHANNTRKTSSFHFPSASFISPSTGLESSFFPLPDTPTSQSRYRRQQSGEFRTSSLPHNHAANSPAARRHADNVIDIQAASFPITSPAHEDGGLGAFRVNSTASSTSQLPEAYASINIPPLDSYYQPTRLKISPNVTADHYEGQTVRPEPPNSRVRLCDLTSKGKYVDIAEEVDTNIRVHDNYVSFIVPRGWIATRTSWGFYLASNEYIGFVLAAPSRNATSMLLDTDRLCIFSKVRVLASPVFESTHTAVVTYVAHDLKGRGIAQYNAGFRSGAVVFALCAPQDEAHKLKKVEEKLASNAVVIDSPPEFMHRDNTYSGGDVGKQYSTSTIVWNKICSVLKRR